MPDVMNNWWGIFKEGVFKNGTFKADSAVLDKIVSATHAREYQNDEIPITIGHPKTDSPKFGSVKKTDVKKVGKILFAKPSHLAPQFSEWVKNKMYDTVSIKLRPEDYSIKHIAFLGGTPPEVTGLPAIAFSEGENDIVLEFDEFAEYKLSKWHFNQLAVLLRGVKNYFIDKEGLEKANELMPENLLTDISEAPGIYQEDKTSFNENKSEDKVTLEELEAKNLDFSEQLNAAIAAKQVLEAEKADLVKKDKEREFLSFCESGQMKKKITPAIKQRVVSILHQLDGVGELTFSEDEKEVKENAVEAFKKVLAILPDQLDFEEKATKENADTEYAEAPAEVKTGLTIAALVNNKN
jgi:hypothetical protein